MKRILSLVLVLSMCMSSVLLISMPTASAAENVLKDIDFEEVTNLADEGFWVHENDEEHGDASIVADPKDGSNKVLKLEGLGTGNYKYRLPVADVPGGELKVSYKIMLDENCDVANYKRVAGMRVNHNAGGDNYEQFAMWESRDTNKPYLNTYGIQDFDSQISFKNQWVQLEHTVHFGGTGNNKVDLKATDVATPSNTKSSTNNAATHTNDDKNYNILEYLYFEFDNAAYVIYVDDIKISRVTSDVQSVEGFKQTKWGAAPEFVIDLAMDTNAGDVEAALSVTDESDAVITVTAVTASRYSVKVTDLTPAPVYSLVLDGLTLPGAVTHKFEVTDNEDDEYILKKITFNEPVYEALAGGSVIGADGWSVADRSGDSAVIVSDIENGGGNVMKITSTSSTEGTIFKLDLANIDTAGKGDLKISYTIMLDEQSELLYGDANNLFAYAKVQADRWRWGGGAYETDRFLRWRVDGNNEIALSHYNAYGNDTLTDTGITFITDSWLSIAQTVSFPTTLLKAEIALEPNDDYYEAASESFTDIPAVVPATDADTIGNFDLLDSLYFRAPSFGTSGDVVMYIKDITIARVPGAPKIFDRGSASWSGESKFDVEVRVDNADWLVGDNIVLIAAYNKDTKHLMDVQMATVTKENSIVEKKTLYYPEEMDAEDIEVRVFLWKADNIMPLNDYMILF